MIDKLDAARGGQEQHFSRAAEMCEVTQRTLWLGLPPIRAIAAKVGHARFTVVRLPVLPTVSTCQTAAV